MDLAEWDESIRKSYAKENVTEFTYICEPKYDGICLELVYEDGELKYGITR
jgi:NAD-dependent DNA ligase